MTEMLRLFFKRKKGKKARKSANVQNAISTSSFISRRRIVSGIKKGK